MYRSSPWAVWHLRPAEEMCHVLIFKCIIPRKREVDDAVTQESPVYKTNTSCTGPEALIFDINLQEFVSTFKSDICFSQLSW